MLTRARDLSQCSFPALTSSGDCHVSTVSGKRPTKVRWDIIDNRHLLYEGWINVPQTDFKQSSSGKKTVSHRFKDSITSKHLCTVVSDCVWTKLCLLYVRPKSVISISQRKIHTLSSIIIHDSCWITFLGNQTRNAYEMWGLLAAKTFYHSHESQSKS